MLSSTTAERRALISRSDKEMGFSTDSNQGCPDQYRCRDRTAIALPHREAKYPLRDSYLYRCAQGAPEKLPVLSARHGILYGVAVKGLTGSILVATGVLFDREMRKVVRCARGTRTVVFPRTATGARDEAFSSSALRSAVVCESVELLGRTDEKDAWPARAGIFQTSMLARVSLPRTLRVLGKSVFKYCVALRRVCLPDSLTVIGPECIYGSELEEVAVLDAVETIGARAFYHCSWLRHVSFRESSRLREIREEAFAVSGLAPDARPGRILLLQEPAERLAERGAGAAGHTRGHARGLPEVLSAERAASVHAAGDRAAGVHRVREVGLHLAPAERTQDPWASGGLL